MGHTPNFGVVDLVRPMVRIKKTLPISFNNTFRSTKECMMWNSNVAQRHFIPFHSVPLWFRFILFRSVGNLHQSWRVELLQEARADSEGAKAITSLVLRLCILRMFIVFMVIELRFKKKKKKKKIAKM